MNQKLRNLVYTAMLMALCCVATLVIKIPTVTGGYLNAGDIVVVLAALLAGPLYGGVAAGFGSGLADVISGYMSYAPGTLVVKGRRGRSADLPRLPQEKLRLCAAERHLRRDHHGAGLLRV